MDILSNVILLAGGFIGGLINRSMNNHHEMQKYLAAKSFKDVQNARGVTDPHIAWTRRTIALLIIMSIFFLPTFVNVIWGVPTYIAYEESNGVFMSLLSGEHNIIWKQLPSGVVLTPYHFALASTVVGFYFGKSIK